MPQSIVNYTERKAYPGLVVHGSTTSYMGGIREYNRRYWNASNVIIPYGRIVRYAQQARGEGGLIPELPETQDIFRFKVAGISALIDPYYYHGIYPGHVIGYKPREMVSVLQSGDIWLPVWDSVKEFEPISFKEQPLLGQFTFPGEQKLTGLFSSQIGRDQKVLQGSHWVTSADAGELALARIKLLDPIDPLIFGGDDF